jgi:hypothetical protein
MADSTSTKSGQIVAEQRDIQHVVDSESENGAASSSGATQGGKFVWRNTGRCASLSGAAFSQTVPAQTW